MAQKVREFYWANKEIEREEAAAVVARRVWRGGASVEDDAVMVV